MIFCITIKKSLVILEGLIKLFSFIWSVACCVFLIKKSVVMFFVFLF